MTHLVGKCAMPQMGMGSCSSLRHKLQTQVYHTTAIPPVGSGKPTKVVFIACIYPAFYFRPTGHLPIPYVRRPGLLFCKMDALLLCQIVS